MVARGSYAKGVAKREEILTTALDVIARHGYRKTSIRELAAAVGLSQTGLLHYFGTKEQLFVEILRKRDEVDAAQEGFGSGFDIDRDFIEGFTAVIRHNMTVPGLVQLYAQFSTEATDASHPANAFFAARTATFRGMVADSIRRRQASGELDAQIDAHKTAAIMIAATDGLQTEWMLDPSIDMPEHIAYLWKRLTSSGVE